MRFAGHNAQREAQRLLGGASTLLASVHKKVPGLGSVPAALTSGYGGPHPLHLVTRASPTTRTATASRYLRAA